MAVTCEVWSNCSSVELASFTGAALIQVLPSKVFTVSTFYEHESLINSLPKIIEASSVSRDKAEQLASLLVPLYREEMTGDFSQPFSFEVKFVC